MTPAPGPIAYLTGEYPRATDTFIQREVAALRALGFTIHTCTIRRTATQHHTDAAQRAEAAATFAVLPATLRLSHPGAHLRALGHPGRYLRALVLAWRTAPRGLRGRAYNLVYFAEAVTLAAHLRAIGAVHLHNHIAKASCTVAMLASALTGIPFSFTLHGPDDLWEPAHWHLHDKIARAAFVACISQFCRAQAMLFADRADWDRLHVVHCGVDPDAYPAASGTGDQLVFVGRLAAVKGLPVLFQALAQARRTRPGLRLTLIGDGPDRAVLKDEARTLGLDATFLGYRAPAEVAQVLATADALVLPSFAEGVPVVLMEAMAARLPVIATRVAGVPELVEHGIMGLLVPPGDADALASAILTLMADPALRAAMGAAGQAQVARAFDAATEAAVLAALFKAAGGNR